MRHLALALDVGDWVSEERANCHASAPLCPLSVSEGGVTPAVNDFLAKARPRILGTLDEQTDQGLPTTLLADNRYGGRASRAFL